MNFWLNFPNNFLQLAIKNTKITIVMIGLKFLLIFALKNPHKIHRLMSKHLVSTFSLVDFYYSTKCKNCSIDDSCSNVLL